MKKILTITSLIFLLSFCSSIAVIAPAVYVATLSITAFLANILITVAVFIAAKSFSSKNALSKGISTKIGFAIEIIGKTTLLITSTAIAIIIVNPILISEAILTGVLASIICGIILFLYNYKRISISQSKTKKSIIISALIFCTFVFFSSALVGYYSIEIKPIVQEGKGVTQTSQELQSPLFDIANSFNKSQSQQASAPSQGIDSESKPEYKTQTLIFNPTSLNECIISSGENKTIIQPQNNCFSNINGIQKRVICPIVISDLEYTSGSTVSSSGSCSETYLIQ